MKCLKWNKNLKYFSIILFWTLRSSTLISKGKSLCVVDGSATPNLIEHIVNSGIWMVHRDPVVHASPLLASLRLGDEMARSVQFMSLNVQHSILRPNHSVFITGKLVFSYFSFESYIEEVTYYSTYILKTRFWSEAQNRNLFSSSQGLLVVPWYHLAQCEWIVVKPFKKTMLCIFGIFFSPKLNRIWWES